MYIPGAFREERLDVLHKVMRTNSFATVVSNGPNGLIATQMEISRLEGKRKLSQNRSCADQESVANGLARQGDPLGSAVADLIQEDLSKQPGKWADNQSIPPDREGRRAMQLPD